MNFDNPTAIVENEFKTETFKRSRLRRTTAECGWRTSSPTCKRTTTSSTRRRLLASGPRQRAAAASQVFDGSGSR